MGSFVNNYQLDTTMAKADSLYTIIILSPNSSYPNSFNTRSLDGIQYFSHIGYSNTLKSLTVRYLNNLVDMPATMPDVYSTIEIKYCPAFTTLSVFGDSVTSLTCEQVNISTLPALPNRLQTLCVNRSPISAITQLPASLKTLLLEQDQFTSLPVLPVGLQMLAADNNYLTALPSLPASLTSLSAYNNLLTYLPQLPAGLISLGLANNYITQLPQLPIHLESISVNNNPGLTCLPILPDSLYGLDFANTLVSCIPNRPVTLINLVPSYAVICTDTDVSCPYGGVSGYVYWDRDSDCRHGSADPAFDHAVISIDNGQHFTMTDSRGFYRAILDSGTHTISPVYDSVLFKAACASSYTIYYNGWDTVTYKDFALQTNRLCHNMSIDVAGNRQRICSSTNNYVVYYSNRGTDTAYNTTIDVQVDPVTVILATNPTWSSILPGNIYHFNIGSVAPFSQGGITISDSVSCAAVIGQAGCIKAKIWPRNSCATVSPLWDSSEVVVSSSYVPTDDSIAFKMTNTGHAMNGPVEYRVYEDELLQLVGHVQLGALDSLVYHVKANGHTYRMEADQNANHPGNSMPRNFRELAGGPPYYLGFVTTVPQDDADEWVEITCGTIRGSYDPNEKEVAPAGIGPNHYITAADDLDYVIHFQNTGNDTAYKVVLIDSLDAQHLDLRTFRSGISSHRYEVNLGGTGIAKWTFYNVQLPDSGSNEPASKGYVQFKVKQRAGNTPGTRINNFADIYFDANSPVRTNTTFVTIERFEVMYPLSVKDINVAAGYKVNAYPNPFNTAIQFGISAEQSSGNEYEFVVTDMLGRKVVDKHIGSSYELSRNNLNAGVYLYKISQNGKPVGSGKIIAQ
jgi:hypothetical protein